MRGGRPGSSSQAEGPLPSRDAFERAHRELIEDRSIQFELTPERTELPPRQFDLFSLDLGSLPRIVFWVVLALAAAGLLYLIAARASAWRRHERATERAAPDWQIEEEPARQLLGDADALAAQGRYSEAAHLLLYRSIEEIDRRRPAAVRKALTSRDIARLPAIPPSPAGAFARIVRAVEHSLFGGRPLDAGDWRECRDAYERFAFAREWQP